VETLEEGTPGVVAVAALAGALAEVEVLEATAAVTRAVGTLPAVVATPEAAKVVGAPAQVAVAALAGAAALQVRAALLLRATAAVQPGTAAEGYLIRSSGPPHVVPRQHQPRLSKR
jgi:hypothetical protein